MVNLSVDDVATIPGVDVPGMPLGCQFRTWHLNNSRSWPVQIYLSHCTRTFSWNLSVDEVLSPGKVILIQASLTFSESNFQEWMVIITFFSQALFIKYVKWTKLFPRIRSMNRKMEIGICWMPFALETQLFPVHSYSESPPKNKNCLSVSAHKQVATVIQSSLVFAQFLP